MTLKINKEVITKILFVINVTTSLSVMLISIHNQNFVAAMGWFMAFYWYMGFWIATKK